MRFKLQVKEHIQAGDVFQLVLSQRFERRTKADPFEIYRSALTSSRYAYLEILCHAHPCISMGRDNSLKVTANSRCTFIREKADPLMIMPWQGTQSGESLSIYDLRPGQGVNFSCVLARDPLQSRVRWHSHKQVKLQLFRPSLQAL